MSHPLKWEFPGGKLEAGETPEDCLQREIREELGLQVELLERLPSYHHTYPANFQIRLLPFRCRILRGALKLAEHKQVKWLAPNELRDLNWAEADISIVEYYLESYK